MRARQEAARIDPATPIVEATDLRVVYPGRLRQPAFTAVDGVDLAIRPGEVLGLVGESGSGKTTIGRAIAGLTPISGGSLKVHGVEMLGVKEKTFRPVRKRIGFVFQDPATSFNPLLTIAQCVAELALRELAPVFDEHVAQIVAERERLGASLQALPRLTVHPSVANFFFVTVDADADALAAALRARRVLVRSFHSQGGRMRGTMRITVGTPAENASLIEALEATLPALA